MPEYMGPDELGAEKAPAAAPLPKQMGGREPVQTDEPMVTLFYLLLRDCIAPGDLEHKVCEIEQGAAKGHVLSNEFLAGYAENITERLVKASELRTKALNREASDHGE